QWWRSGYRFFPGRLLLYEHAHRVERQAVFMLAHPAGRFAVEWALHIVRLVGDHLADPGHDAPQRLARTPVVADADGVRGDVRVEDGRQHPALRRQARIAARQDDLDQVLRHDLDVVIDAPQAAQMVLDLIAARRIALGGDQAHARVAADI